MNRRSLLLGIGSLIAAPAVVRAESLMKIMVLRESVKIETIRRYRDLIVNSFADEQRGLLVFQTLNAAFTDVRVGDRIVIAPGHTETIATLILQEA